MMANRIQIGMMGDYPLMVNGATGQETKNETQLVAVIAYNAFGSGNGIVVHKDSPFYAIEDLKVKEELKKEDLESVSKAVTAMRSSVTANASTDLEAHVKAEMSDFKVSTIQEAYDTFMFN